MPKEASPPANPSLTDEAGQYPLLFGEGLRVVEPGQAQESPDNRFSSFVVYVDESGDHSLESVDPNYPVFVLAFCVFHKGHYAQKARTKTG